MLMEYKKDLRMTMLMNTAYRRLVFSRRRNTEDRMDVMDGMTSGKMVGKNSL